MTHPPTDPRSLPADVKRKLLAARDALTEGDAMEAYHQIYSIASPHFDKLTDEVWTGLESPSPEPAEQRLNKAARRIVDGAFALRDHMTSCDKTMGATHACTCGMWAYARLLQELDSPETKAGES